MGSATLTMQYVLPKKALLESSLWSVQHQVNIFSYSARLLNLGCFICSGMLYGLLLLTSNDDILYFEELLLSVLFACYLGN